jgi:hypothetical protein
MIFSMKKDQNHCLTTLGTRPRVNLDLALGGGVHTDEQKASESIRTQPKLTSFFFCATVLVLLRFSDNANDIARMLVPKLA